MYSQGSKAVLLILEVSTILYVRFSSLRVVLGPGREDQREVIKKGVCGKPEGKKSDCGLLFNILMAYQSLLLSPKCLHRHLSLKSEGKTWLRACSSSCDVSSLRMHTKYVHSRRHLHPEDWSANAELQRKCLEAGPYRWKPGEGNLWILQKNSFRTRFARGNNLGS